MRIIKYDVLVIGSGAAGLRAAIEAHDSGTRVSVAGKCRKGDAHTVLATGGINAALGTMDMDDSWIIHAADTLREGRFLADYRAVEILCRNAPAAIKDLVKYGVKFARDKNSKLIQRYFGAHTFRRTCFVGDETGKAVEKALVKETVKRKINFFEEVYIISILKTKNKINSAVNGAFGFDVRTGEAIVFNAKCVVLAAGGYSRLYQRSSSRVFENTGDGIALALGAGAELQDMEMVQFHPTGMVCPKEAEGVLVTEAVRGEGGRLFNSRNERLMKFYDPKRMELGPRDEVARAIYNEIEKGRGTRHGGVWLDISHRQKSYILQRLPKMYRQFKHYSGIDISRNRMEVAPTAHYSMGGVRTRLDCSTNVKGLFAVGEVTGGIHGANRLGGNSLAETIVFGKIAGRSAAKYAKAHPLYSADYGSIREANIRLKKFLGRRKGNPAGMKKEIQELMWEKAGIARNARDMSRALQRIEALGKKAAGMRAGNSISNSQKLVDIIDSVSMLAVAETVMKSALIRKESRGAHYRSDYPKESKKNLFNIVCRKSWDRLIFRKHKVARPKGRIAKELKTKRRISHGFAE